MTSLQSGQIQRHGALLAIDDHDLVIVAASENVEAILGVARVIGSGIGSAIATPSERMLRDLLAGELENINPIAVTAPDGRALDAMVHRAHGFVILELEPARERVQLGRIERGVARVHASHALVATALAEIAALTGMATVELHPGRGTPCFIADRMAAPVALVGSAELAGRAHEITGVQLASYAVDGSGALLVLDAGDHAIVCEHPAARRVEVTARIAAQIIAHAIPVRTEVYAPTAHGELAGVKLLVVDDSPEDGEVLALLFESTGAITLVARTAADGLAAVAAFHPDAVIATISPDLDGFELMRQVRALGPNEGGWVPAIAISGRADPEHAREAILAGYQLHVSQPIEPPDLVARLARLVARTARRT